MEQFLETGKIVSTHGVAGLLRVQPWCDSPEFLTETRPLFLNGGQTQLDVESAKVHGHIVLLKLAGVGTITDAQPLIGQVIYIDKSSVKLAEGQHFVADLLGCRVFNAGTGDELGELTEVSKTGANDVWHLMNNGKEYLIPVIKDVVKSVDIENKHIEITPLAGIFDS